MHLALAGRSHLLLLPAAKLALHLASHRGYGYFRDEFYYLACAARLAPGYVDHPPLSIVLLRVVRELLGDSLLAVRLLPALAGAATLLLVGLITKEMGGGRLAQTLAMTGALVAPVYLSFGHFYSMNAFDILCWAGAAYLVVRLLAGGPPVLWPWLGLVLGLGLLNKISVLWLGFGLFCGLLATSRRRDFLTRWPWLAALVACAFCLPYLIWQLAHGWPTLEFIRNATQQKMVAVAPLAFLRGQAFAMNLVALPLWLGGLAWLLVTRAGSRFRALGVAYLAVFALLLASGSSRAGYLAPAYTWLLAAGGVALEAAASRTGRRWLGPAALVVLILGGLWRAPLALPVLSVPAYVRYAAALGVAPATAERKALSRLPQFYADMHGWESIVDTVARVHSGLAPERRARSIVFTPNYGVAGAIELLGPARGLPPVYSGHNNYWFWGPPQQVDPVVIIVGGEGEEHQELFTSVERAAVTDCGDCMPYENGNPVYVCEGLRRPVPELWPLLKHFD